MASKAARSSKANSLKVVGKGYLRMKKKKAMSKWYKRYCELDGPQFKYYDHFIRGVEDNVARGLIVLEKDAVLISQSGKEFSIKTISGDIYIFQGTSGHDATTWFNLINENFKTVDELKKILGENYREDQTAAARKKRRETSEKKIKQRNSNKNSDTDAFDVLVPEGYAPGMQLNVEFNERTFTVTIPDGIYEGQVFEVRLNKANPVSNDETIQHAGWMYKYARTGMAGAKKKWFILTDYTLSYMDDEGMSAKMVWSLGDATATVNADTIQFTSAGETLKFGCGTADNARTWMNRLQLCMNAAKGDSTTDLSADHSANTSTDDKGVFVGKVLSGKPIMAGWITKHATHNMGVGKPKLKWFMLNKTHLVYSDYEGQAIKREWLLSKCRMIFTRAYHVVLLQGRHQTLQLSFEMLSEAVRWTAAISRVIALHQIGMRTVKTKVPLTHTAGGPTIPITLQIPVPPRTATGQSFSLFVHMPDKANQEAAAAAAAPSSSGPDENRTAKTRAPVVAAMCNGTTTLINIPASWDLFKNELEIAFSLPSLGYTVTDIDGAPVKTMQQLRTQHEVLVTVHKAEPAAAPALPAAAGAASAPGEMSPEVSTWLATHKLAQHKDKLVQNGILTAKALQSLKASDVSKMGFTAIAGRKFLTLCQSFPGNGGGRSPTRRTSSGGRSPTRRSSGGGRSPKRAATGVRKKKQPTSPDAGS